MRSKRHHEHLVTEKTSSEYDSFCPPKSKKRPKLKEELIEKKKIPNSIAAEKKTVDLYWNKGNHIFYSHDSHYLKSTLTSSSYYSNDSIICSRRQKTKEKSCYYVNSLSASSSNSEISDYEEDDDDDRSTQISLTNNHTPSSLFYFETEDEDNNAINNDNNKDNSCSNYRKGGNNEENMTLNNKFNYIKSNDERVHSFNFTNSTVCQELKQTKSVSTIKKMRHKQNNKRNLKLLSYSKNNMECYPIIPNHIINNNSTKPHGRVMRLSAVIVTPQD